MAVVKGTRVQCVDCNGRHTGTVVRVSGLWYGVTWDDRNANFGQPGNTEPQYPEHFVKQHAKHLVTVGDLAVEAIH